MENILHLYLGQKVQVRKKLDASRKEPEEPLIGQIVEVTKASNHGDWIMVRFDWIQECTYHGFNERSSNAHTFFIEEDEIKLLLRPLSSMTADELKECNIEMGQILLAQFPKDGGLKFFAPKQFQHLLSKGFDLFSLIPEGKAIDSTKK